MPALPLRPTVSSALWSLSVLLALLVMGVVWPGQMAQAASLSFAPSFSPSQFLGEASTLSAQFTFTGTEYHGSPDPLTEVIVHLPAGVGGTSSGSPTCSELTLESFGTAGCPAGSLAGPLSSVGVDIEEGHSQNGHFVAERIHKTGTIQPVFANPEETTKNYIFDLEVPGFPVILVSAYYLEDAPPYGRELRLEFPLMESIPGQPFASVTSLTLTLGASREENGQLISSLTIPQECPADGRFPWAADVTYTTNVSPTEQTHAHTTAETVCPASSGKVVTTTTLEASSVSPHAGEVVSYTATVTPTVQGASMPSGPVTFLDGGDPITGCTDQPLVAGTASSTASCQLSYITNGSHQITARYGGDSGYFGSESSIQSITVSAELPHQALKQTEAPTTPQSPLVPCCDGPAQPLLTSSAQLKTSLVSQLTPTGKAASIAALLKSGGYVASFKALEAGTLMIDWYELPHRTKLARTSKATAKPVLVASGQMIFNAASTGKIKIGLTAAGKRLLKHAKQLKLTAKGTFTPTHKAPVSAMVSLVVKL